MTAGETLTAVGILEHAAPVRPDLFQLVRGIYRYAVMFIVLAFLLDIDRVGQQALRHFWNRPEIGDNLLFQFFLFLL